MSSFQFRIFLLLVYAIPLGLLTWFVQSFSVNVPVGDQWELVSFFDKFATKSLNLEDFFSQHNEHRIIFPKILFTILAFTSKWNIKLELGFSIFLVILTFFTLYKIAEVSHNKNKILFYSANAIGCILIFSLVQYENWLWGFQIAWFLINACVVIAVFILTVPKKWSPSLRLSLSALFCFIASFSSAHGLFSWLAIIPAVISVEGKVKQKITRLILWIIFFIIFLGIYSINYDKPGHHPDTFFFLKEPLIAGQYFLTILGVPVGKSIFLASVSGFILLLSFLFFNICFLKDLQSKFAKKIAPWLSISWFTILFALLTTLGRAGFGIEQAMSSRYTTVSILLIISCLQMWCLLVCEQQQEFGKNTYQFLWLGILVTLLTAIFIPKSVAAISQGRQIKLERTVGQTCLEVINYLDESIAQLPDQCLRYLYPDSNRIRDLAKSLEGLDFRDFPEDIAFVNEPSTPHGHIDSPSITDLPVVVSKSDNVNLAGWAILPQHSEQPKIVLISHDDKQSFFASAIVKLDRPDVAGVFDSDQYSQAGWEINLPLTSLPAGETIIKAWVYDRENKQFVQLVGEPKIKVVD